MIGKNFPFFFVIEISRKGIIVYSFPSPSFCSFKNHQTFRSVSVSRPPSSDYILSLAPNRLSFVGMSSSTVNGNDIGVVNTTESSSVASYVSSAGSTVDYLQ